jgi:hypothetical protein
MLDVKRALARCEVVAASPLGAATARARAWAGAAVPASELVEAWKGRQPGSTAGSTRYRWDLSHFRCKLESFAGKVVEWRAWRPTEQQELDRDPHRFEERLILPILIAESAVPPGKATRTEGTRKPRFFECEPVLRRDLAHALLNTRFRRWQRFV